MMMKHVTGRWRQGPVTAGAWVRLGLAILAGFTATIGRAQTSFSTPQVLAGPWGSVTNDDTGVTPDPGAPSNAGAAPVAPLWYQWTAPLDGEVTLDTYGSQAVVSTTNVFLNRVTGQLVTNVVTTTNVVDTVLGVYAGNNLTTLSQIAANDDLYPVAQLNYTGQNIYITNFPNEYSTNPFARPVFAAYDQPYSGPSGLRFHASAGTTYYFVEDTKSVTGPLVLNWAYHSSGVLRFASEDVDQTGVVNANGTPMLLYTAAETEGSRRIRGTLNVDQYNSTLHTYYPYDVPGVLVTVTRVAGSSGRVQVDYSTEPADTNMLDNGDIPAVAGLDYYPVSGTLTFDDFEMSKTIFIPVFDDYGAYRPNRDLLVVLSNPRLDQYEDAASVSPPRVDGNFGEALVRILDCDIDPKGESGVSMVVTNTDPVTGSNNVVTNMTWSLIPTNAVFNFMKAHFRVPRDVTNWWGGTPITVYVCRTGTNTGSETVYWSVNNFFLDKDTGQDNRNIEFPLQPGSDYAVPDPATTAGILGTNSDFSFSSYSGSLTFPGGTDFNPQPITFTVYDNGQTTFNKDFQIDLYQLTSDGAVLQPGMVAQATVTILTDTSDDNSQYNDNHPPAGAVDENWNPDWGLRMAPSVNTTPQNINHPGADGEVYGLSVLPNNESVIVGDFASYNGAARNGIALISTSGALDPFLNPGSGANDSINAVAPDGRQYVIGGAFSSFNGAAAGGIARLNANGSLDTAFQANTGEGANGTVWAVAAQPDGRILVAGDFTTFNGVPRNYIARLNANGTLDTTFDPGNTFNGPIYSLARRPSLTAFNSSWTRSSSSTNEDDTSVNVPTDEAGTATLNFQAAESDTLLVLYGGVPILNYTAPGSGATNTFVVPFGPGSSPLMVVVNPGNSANAAAQWSYTAALNAASTNATVVVGGAFAVSGQQYSDIARLNGDGTLDTTFNPGFGADGPVFALGWQFNNRILAGGAFTHFNGAPENNVVRLDANGTIDNNFYSGSGADATVYSVTALGALTLVSTNAAGTSATYSIFDTGTYLGGDFDAYNGTHRLSFARLYADGTLDTTFLDAAYNQFAGLPRTYSYDVPEVFAAGVQSDGNVMIGGNFTRVGGGQSDDADIRPDSVDSNNLAVYTSYSYFGRPEPKSRDGVRNRSNLARLIGGATPGPGNVTLASDSFSVTKHSQYLYVGLVRTNGSLGPVSANFSVQPALAQSGLDYAFNAPEPLYWVGWVNAGPSRDHSYGLFGINGYVNDIFGKVYSGGVAALSEVQLAIYNDTQNPGDLNAFLHLTDPAQADQFYLGGEDIPLGAALGHSYAPLTIIDDNQQAGTFGFASTNFIATNGSPIITVVRTNGSYGKVSMKYYTVTNGSTAVAYVDYSPISPPGTLQFQNQSLVTNFDVTVLNSGVIYTNMVEKTVQLQLSSLNGPVGGNAMFGITNAVLRLINPNYQGYLTLSASNYTAKVTAGQVAFVVNRVSGSKGTLTVQYATADGSAISGVNYLGATNTLTWNSGDVSPRVITLPLINDENVGDPDKTFTVTLSNPALNGVPAPSLMGLITSAAVTIVDDNQLGTLRFSSPDYLVSEDGGYATLTVIRTGGSAGTISAVYATRDGTATNGVNYIGVTNTLTLGPGQLGASFNIPILDDGVIDPPPSNFFFNVSLIGPTTGTNTEVHIVDAQTYNQPPGDTDTSFNSGGGMDGDVLALALQPDGGILAGGNFTHVSNVSRNHIARLNFDGSLDTAFLNQLSGANAPVRTLALQSDGRVLIGGSFTAVDGTRLNYVARLMSDGSVDSSFNPGAGADSSVYALAEAFVGGIRKIYVGGAFGSVNNTHSPGIIRLNDNGTVDGAFATGVGADGAVYAIAVYPTNSVFAGKLLIGGAFTHYNGTNVNYLARLNADGSVDNSFNIGVGADNAIQAVAIQPDGRILLGGTFTNFNGVAVNHVVRLNPDGSVDANFVANDGGGANDTVEAIALQGDDRILLAGQFTRAGGVTRHGLTRLLPSGAVDPTINFGDGANGDVAAVAVQPADAKIVIGGGFTEFNSQPASHIARIYGGSATGSGAFQFNSANYQVNENGLLAAVTVRRTGGTSGTNVTVHFATGDGTAMNGVNYQAVATNLDFPPGETFETVYVPILDDLKVTPNLTVNLALSNPTGGAVIGDQPTATLTIVESDSVVSFLSSYYSQVKNAPTKVADIDVLRQGGTNGTASVDFYTTTNGTAVAGTDYYPTNLTVVFNPGQTDVVVQVPIINNNLAEGNRTVGLLLTNAVNTTLVAPSNAVLTIIDTVNAPGQIAFMATNYTAYESGGYAYLTLVRTNGSSGSVSVGYYTVPGTAQPGVNYSDGSGTVTFIGGQTNAAIQIPLITSGPPQAPVSLTVGLTNATGGATLIAPTNAALTIVDDLSTGFGFLNVTNYVRETNGVAPIFVQRLGNTNGSVQVNYATTNGTAVAGVNYVAASNILTFNPGQTLKAVSLQLIHDPQVTGDLKMMMRLSNPSAGTQLGLLSNTVVVIQDADAGFSFSNANLSVPKNAGFATIEVICSNPGIEPPLSTNVTPLSVQYYTADGSATAGQDYQAVNGTILFTNGIGTNIVNVPVINNSLITGTRTFTIHMANPTAPGQLIAPATETVSIVDNNSGLAFSRPSYNVARNAGMAAITVVRLDNLDTNSTVDYAASNGTAVAGMDYTPVSGTLVFTNGQASATFSVPVLGNSVVQPDRTVLLQLSSPVNGFLTAPYAATLTIYDTSGSLVVPAGSTLVGESFAPPNGIIDPGETVTNLFAFRAAGGTNVANLVAALLATNGVLFPSGPQSYGPLIVGGPSAARPFSFTANGTNGQQIIASFKLQDGTNDLGIASFSYMLGKWTTSFTNPAPIIINDIGIATPYPSGITVSNVGGTLLKATVTVTNLNHTWPSDIDMLLVSPAAQDALFMAHAGGSYTIHNVTLTFDDAATNSLPQFNMITSGTNKPTAYLPVPNFP